jgi:hypothetical protein
VSVVEAIRVLIKAVRMPIEIVGEPKEAARVYNTLNASTTLSQPWESSSELSVTSQESMLVDSRGLESALEAVRVSVEAMRVSIEALRCFRGRERLEEVPENVNWGRESVAEATKVPVEVVREPAGKIVLTNSGTNQNVLVLFQSF